MEAMKMEAEIRVPHVGTLRRFQVKEGDIVAHGETLAWLG